MMEGSTMYDPKNGPVLVTGATGGIGGAIVRQLTALGADVIASGRNADALAQMKEQYGCRAVRFDLSSETEVEAALGGLDVYGVVNCGGFGGEIATPMETDINVFDATIEVNTRGALLVIKEVSKTMIANGCGGSIVNVSSQASLVALAGHVSYAASKGALDSITRVSALELGRHNIRVNGVHPTVVMTEMSEFYWGRKEIGGPFLQQMPLGRWATEDEIAAPVIFLLGEGASMISGVALPVDGGYCSC